jgi:hypothetical protein
MILSVKEDIMAFYKVKAVIQLEIETTLEEADDIVSIGDEVETLVLEDLEDIGGYIINDSKTISSEVVKI